MLKKQAGILKRAADVSSVILSFSILFMYSSMNNDLIIKKKVVIETDQGKKI